LQYNWTIPETLNPTSDENYVLKAYNISDSHPPILMANSDPFTILPQKNPSASKTSSQSGSVRTATKPAYDTATHESKSGQLSRDIAIVVALFLFFILATLFCWLIPYSRKKMPVRPIQMEEAHGVPDQPRPVTSAT
jgi:hypothetical protein